MKERVVLSLFNGMSTGHQAFKNLGVKIKRYYSSEIKKSAIKITQFHFPDTIQLGDVTNWREWDVDWGEVDIILSGSPCQDLSIAGKRKGIRGDRSGLFFVFIEILEHVRKFNPGVKFFQENVASASQEDVNVISRALGINPININSNLVVAQNRNRLYWSNIRTKTDGLFGDIVQDIPQPKDEHIYLQDILTSGIAVSKKSPPLLQSDAKTYGYTDMRKFTKFIKKRASENRQIPAVVIQLLEASRELCAYKGGYIRPLNKIELCRLQGFSDNYCDILTRNQAASVLGDGWTLPVIEHYFSFLGW